MTTCFSGLGETLFQTSLNIVLVVAQDASILAVNPSALTALGYAENDLINQNISLVLNISDQQSDKIPDLKNVTNQDILKYLISRTNQNEFLNIRHKSDRIFASRIKVGDKTKCPDGVPHYVVCIADNGELHRTISEHDE
jgi:PAS domain S-box-containing protein